MQDPLLNPELREYITSNDSEALRAFAEKTIPAVAAECHRRRDILLSG